MPGDAAERSVHVPGIEVEALYHGIGSPMPVAGECERLPGEVGTERTRDMRDDVERVEIAARGTGYRPGRLPRRGPVEVCLDLHAERVGRTQRAEGVHVRVLEPALGAEEADVVLTDYRGAANVVGLEMEAVVDGQSRAADLGVFDVEDEPGRQEVGRSRSRGLGAAFHLDEGVLHLAVRHADGL